MQYRMFQSSFNWKTIEFKFCSKKANSDIIQLKFSIDSLLMLQNSIMKQSQG